MDGVANTRGARCGLTAMRDGFERGVMRFVEGYQIKETDSKAELRQGVHKSLIR